MRLGCIIDKLAGGRPHDAPSDGTFLSSGAIPP
jgi:hypothetical protein